MHWSNTEAKLYRRCFRRCLGNRAHSWLAHTGSSYEAYICICLNISKWNQLNKTTHYRFYWDIQYMMSSTLFIAHWISKIIRIIYLSTHPRRVYWEFDNIPGIKSCSPFKAQSNSYEWHSRIDSMFSSFNSVSMDQLKMNTTQVRMPFKTTLWIDGLYRS